MRAWSRSRKYRLAIGLALIIIAMSFSWRAEQFSASFGLAYFFVTIISLFVGSIMFMESLFNMPSIFKKLKRPKEPLKKPKAKKMPKIEEPIEEEGIKSIFDRPFVLFLIILCVLPFLLTPVANLFSGVLTLFVVQTGLYLFIRHSILPIQARMLAAVLESLGFKVTVLGYSVIVMEKGQHVASFGLLWNCIGWQTIILMLASMAVPLFGSYTFKSKIMCIILGIEAALIIIFLRIILASLTNFYFGYWPAVVFHDWFGTAFMLAGLIIFWYISLTYVLVKKPKEFEEIEEET